MLSGSSEKVMGVLAGLLILALGFCIVNANECWPARSQDFWNGCLGDIDADGDVDLVDLAFVMDRIGTNDLAADLDMDGVVTDSDLNLVRNELGDSCNWPPERHATLRIVTDSSGGDIWLDLPEGAEVIGIQAWLLTSPDRSGQLEPDTNTVSANLCSSSFFDRGRIGFSWGTISGHPWVGSVHLGRINGSLGDYIFLHRLSAPPPRCAELLPDGSVHSLRFIVTVESQAPPTKRRLTPKSR